MRTIHAGIPGREYNILIGRGSLNQVGSAVRSALRGTRIALVTDSNVDALYALPTAASLRLSGFQVEKFVLPAGEASKNLDAYGTLLRFLADQGMTRSDAVLALGGGVVGDLAGFAAATYMRGIDLVQVPTTLLAAVDSSVGGKTAVDLPEGKNLAGAFWQPRLVLCDPDTLDTLPKAEFSGGMAEVIKYAAIRDGSLYRAFLPPMDMEKVIARCVEIKRDVVVRDERDAGERQLLNFGHTFGHAIECLSGYRVSHGFAVAMGMALMTRACVKEGIANADALPPLMEALKSFDLPTDCSYGTEELFCAMLADKKREMEKITLIVPTEMGRCERMRVSLPRARALLELALDRGQQS